MTPTTHCLHLPLLFPYQFHKEVMINESLSLLDALIIPRLWGEPRDTAPTEPAYGTACLISAQPGGAWSDWPNHLALFLTEWHAIAPQEGWILWKTPTSLTCYASGQWKHYPLASPFSPPVMENSHVS